MGAVSHPCCVRHTVTVSPDDRVVHLIRDGRMVNNKPKASPINVDGDAEAGRRRSKTDSSRRTRREQRGGKTHPRSTSRPLGTTPDGATVFDAEFRDVKDK